MLVAGLAAPVTRAQDSVSSAGGLPGDAVSAYTVGAVAAQEQVNNYIVDLTEIRSSWGQRYVIGPVLKASASQQNTFFNHLIASTTASSTLTAPGPLARSTYSLWTVAGQGANATRNIAPGSTVAATGIAAQQFAAGFLEFGPGADNIWGNSDDENNIITGVMGVRPRTPDRLFVSRINAASNRSSFTASNATLGLGTIDSTGNVHFSGDGYAVPLGPNPITNKKLFRVPSLGRATTLINVISDAGGADAGTRIVGSTSLTQTVPGIIPQQLSTRPIMLGADLTNNLLAEQTVTPAPLTQTQTHLPTGASARGSLGFSPYTFSAFTGGTSVGTGVIMARNAASTKTRALAAFGLSATGAVTGRVLAEMPTTIGQLVDRDDAFDPASAFGSPENQEFTNYQSQAIFRGASGSAAVTVLPNGDLLMAATVAATGGAASVPQSQNNYIAVARIPAADTNAVTWSVAAHTGNANGAAGGLSKKIFGDNGADGLPNTADAGEGDNVVDATPIGAICLATEENPSASTGPSISAPAFDSAGNIYFTATIELRQTATTVRHTIALMRANFNAATNAYRLEVLADVGDIIAGRNSGRNYQIQFMSVADADSVDAGTTWSTSTVQQPLAGIDRATVGYGSPLSLGAIVFRAKVVYDVNQDSLFVDPSGGVGGGDEAYNVLMAILPRRPLADIAGANQSPIPDNAYSADDIINFLGAYFASNLAVADVAGPNQSIDPDGALTADDIIVFLNAFFSQQ
jgi:hypothetical protein